MSFATGTRVGPYEITSLIGEGGMGQVYRARDPRLGRDVAIKVLPPAFRADADRLRRFEQEARAVGQLSHPHILAVHDVGLHDGSPYIVCELLEGETLRSRLHSGPVQPRKAIEVGLQIARGLAAAHDRGIVHRDLKPESIFLTRDGRVKILDFGIAKLKNDHVGDDGLTCAATETATQAGVVVGTVGYMSPEQVRGDSVDHRSDLFAVGAILHEVLTGRRAFHRATAAETTTAILREDPAPVNEIVPSVPAAVAAIVERCLVKHPSGRIQSAQDLGFDLELVSTLSDRSASAASAASRMRFTAIAVGVAFVIAGAAGLLIGRTTAPQPPRSSTVVAHRLTDFAGLEEHPSLSPDGKSVAFTADSEGVRQIWVRLLSGGPPLRLTHDAADHLYPRWTPDSGAIVYFSPASRPDSSGSLWEVSALGGSARRIAASLGAADVSHDGRYVAFFRLHDDRPELVVTERDGSGLETVVALDPASYTTRRAGHPMIVGLRSNESISGRVVPFTSQTSP